MNNHQFFMQNNSVRDQNNLSLSAQGATITPHSASSSVTGLAPQGVTRLSITAYPQQISTAQNNDATKSASNSSIPNPRAEHVLPRDQSLSTLNSLIQYHDKNFIDQDAEIVKDPTFFLNTVYISGEYCDRYRLLDNSKHYKGYVSPLPISSVLGDEFRQVKNAGEFYNELTTFVKQYSCFEGLMDHIREIKNFLRLQRYQIIDSLVKLKSLTKTLLNALNTVQNFDRFSGKSLMEVMEDSPDIKLAAYDVQTIIYDTCKSLNINVSAANFPYAQVIDDIAYEANEGIAYLKRNNLYEKNKIFVTVLVRMTRTLLSCKRAFFVSFCCSAKLSQEEDFLRKARSAAIKGSIIPFSKSRLYNLVHRDFSKEHADFLYANSITEKRNESYCSSVVCNMNCDVINGQMIVIRVNEKIIAKPPIGHKPHGFLAKFFDTTNISVSPYVQTMHEMYIAYSSSQQQSNQHALLSVKTISLGFYTKEVTGFKVSLQTTLHKKKRLIVSRNIDTHISPYRAFLEYVSVGEHQFWEALQEAGIRYTVGQDIPVEISANMRTLKSRAFSLTSGSYSLIQEYETSRILTANSYYNQCYEVLPSVEEVQYLKRMQNIRDRLNVASRHVALLNDDTDNTNSSERAVLSSALCNAMGSDASARALMAINQYFSQMLPQKSSAEGSNPIVTPDSLQLGPSSSQQIEFTQKEQCSASSKHVTPPLKDPSIGEILHQMKINREHAKQADQQRETNKKMKGCIAKRLIKNQTAGLAQDNVQTSYGDGVSDKKRAEGAKTFVEGIANAILPELTEGISGNLCQERHNKTGTSKKSQQDDPDDPKENIVGTLINRMKKVLPSETMKDTSENAQQEEGIYREEQIETLSSTMEDEDEDEQVIVEQNTIETLINRMKKVLPSETMKDTSENARCNSIMQENKANEEQGDAPLSSEVDEQAYSIHEELSSEVDEQAYSIHEEQGGFSLDDYLGENKYVDALMEQMFDDIKSVPNDLHIGQELQQMANEDTILNNTKPLSQHTPSSSVIYTQALTTLEPQHNQQVSSGELIGKKRSLATDDNESVSFKRMRTQELDDQLLAQGQLRNFAHTLDRAQGAAQSGLLNYEMGTPQLNEWSLMQQINLENGVSQEIPIPNFYPTTNTIASTNQGNAASAYMQNYNPFVSQGNSYDFQQPMNNMGEMPPNMMGITLMDAMMRMMNMTPMSNIGMMGNQVQPCNPNIAMSSSVNANASAESHQINSMYHS